MAEMEVSDVEGLRSGLEEARTTFHDLCGGLDADGWRRPSRNPAWTVGEVVTHLAFYVTTVVPRGVEGALVGRGVSGMPPWLAGSFVAHPLNVMAARWQARRTNPVTLAAGYDAAHHRVLRLLESMAPEQWDCATYTLGRTMTVRDLFAVHPQHLREHLAEVVERRRG